MSLSKARCSNIESVAGCKMGAARNTDTRMGPGRGRAVTTHRNTAAVSLVGPDTCQVVALTWPQ